MSNNSISRKYQQMAQQLNANITERLNSLRESVESTGTAFDNFISRFVISGFNVNDAIDLARKLFKSSRAKFIGIDGSMSSEITFDMVYDEIKSKSSLDI